MALRPISPQPGSARNPADFVGRRRTTLIATRKLGGGGNLLLADPRRLGKTYWLLHFAATTQAFEAVVVDFEGVSSRSQFLVRTIDALRRHQHLGKPVTEHLSGWFENLDVGAGPIKAKVAVQAQSPAKTLADTLAILAEKAPKPLLICMDEVPMAILDIARTESPEAARELLQTLRMLRQQEPRIRWILAGSVGFHHVLAECGATEGELNDLDNLPLGPLADNEAVELAERLMLGIQRTADTSIITHLSQRTGRIPYLLHKIASTLQLNGDGPVSTIEVDEAFEDFIDDPDEFKALAHLLTRLEPNYGIDAKLARQLLDATIQVDNAWIAVSDLPSDGAPETSELIIEKLISDHYLERRGTRVRWRYPTLQYIWARRRGIWDRP